MLKTYGKIFLDILAPANCHLCGRLLSAGPSYDDCLCAGCVATLRRAPLLGCRYCGDGLNAPIDLTTLTCPSCRRRQAPLRRLKTCYLYEGPVRDLIHQFKYANRSYLAKSIASLMARALTQDGDRLLEGADILAPVPLHSCREREREFNQSLMMAEELGATYGIPAENALIRTRNTPPQARLDPPARQRNTRDVFAVSGKTPLGGKKIVVIDDIVTTAATAHEAARALASAGAADITVLAFAKG